MNNYEQVYIAIELHSKHSMIGYMNKKGKYLGQQQVRTSPKNLINQITAISAGCKQLTIEQSNMTFAMAEKLRPYVNRLIVCDPRHNQLIAGSGNKDDDLDTLRLCKLLRLNELKPVWAPKQMGKRRLFYSQVKEYHRLNKEITRNKNQLQANLHHWGIDITLTDSDYCNPSTLTDQIDNPLLTEELVAKMQRIHFLERQKEDQLKRIKTTGSDFWEIAEFQKMTGIGVVGAHTFSAYIQTPHRFPGRNQLIRFCQLAICKRSSGGKQIGYEHLDKAGHSRLKQVSYIAWETAQQSKNEVSGFYQASIERSDNTTNARLNTQRKILTTLWTIWKHKRTYRPEKFYSGDGNWAQ